jgi:hypothetical protein
MKYIYQARKVSGIDFLSFYDIDFEFWNCSDSVIFFLSFYYFTRENYSNLYNPTTEKPSLSVIRNSSRNTKKQKPMYLRCMSASTKAMSHIAKLH